MFGCNWGIVVCLGVTRNSCVFGSNWGIFVCLGVTGE